ncbi:hypothetical protein [Kordia zhangzhouensis]|uniref:hypothetical protein n=1 Tax=Kordia zhangzhouensis TaxID=1620405 RepID=UPI0006299AB4|nr:hypothetical protein [Kordia zhangzhouensis]
MKKVKKIRLLLNKTKISQVNKNTIVGGGETYPCPHTYGQTCTSTLPPTVLNCDDAPSEFGGSCTYEKPE